jgi:hypothetical protein
MPLNYQTASLKEILAHISAGVVVDKAVVQSLRERLFADGRIDRSEANLLFDLNNVTTKNSGHDSAWQDLFVEGISSYLLDDPNSPHKIDESEGAWLAARIGEDGQCDANERALLAHLKQKAKFFDPRLKKLMERNGV